jgi:catechol 2,3-dioxygenase-like lactoylglutathione lyase family enzyme
MGRVRYIAMVAKEPDRLADWYGTTFQTEVLGHSASGDISVTDGFFHIALLKQRPELGPDGQGLGLHHIGIEVDDLGAFERRLKAFDPAARLEREPDDLHHGEYRVFDPNGVVVSVSTRAFGLGAEQRGIPGIRHIAYAVPDTDRGLDFYTQVFEMRELPTSQLRRQQRLRNRFAGDGCTNLALHPYPPDRPGQAPKPGVNHFGFLVTSTAAILDQLGHSTHADQVRPADRPYAEFRVQDPEANLVDISQLKGWEIDTDRWDRAS